MRARMGADLKSGYIGNVASLNAGSGANDHRRISFPHREVRMDGYRNVIISSQGKSF